MTVLVCSSAVALQYTITQSLVQVRFSLQSVCSPLRSRVQCVGAACACVRCVEWLLNADGTKSRAHSLLCPSKHDPLSDSQSLILLRHSHEYELFLLKERRAVHPTTNRADVVDRCARQRRGSFPCQVCFTELHHAPYSLALHREPRMRPPET
jgi:hypothetical protein